MSQNEPHQIDSTLATLLQEKKRRGRPRHKIPRQSVYVALTKEQKALFKSLLQFLPESFSRADIPDMAIITLTVRLNAVRNAVADRDRELPEGITDMESMYYLWDLELPDLEDTKWTSIRLSPQQAVEFGRLQGTFNALFGTNRSQVFALALSLLEQILRAGKDIAYKDFDEYEQYLMENFL